MLDENDQPLLNEYEAGPTTVQKLMGLPWAIGFNALNTFFTQFTFFGSVFVLFLDELGLEKTQIGFLLSLLPFFDMIALFLAPAVRRFGYKRTFLTFWSVRTVFSSLLLLVPVVLTNFGTQAVLLFIAGIVISFAVSRSVAVTALLPWQQEYIPNSIRGKYSATNNIFVNLAGLAAITIAGMVVGSSQEIGRFMLLFGMALVFGGLSVWSGSFIPGGAPPSRQDQAAGQPPLRLSTALRDGNFRLYLLGVGLMALAVTPLASFLPLFMQEKVGLSPGSVVLLQNGTLFGGLLSSYLWGWAADRYGSKPIMLTGAFLTASLPVLWMLMPRQSPLSLGFALAIAFLQGTANLSWGIGSARLLFVSLVPPSNKAAYMALYAAYMGIMGGISQLLGGRLIDLTSGIQGQLWIFEVDSYTVLFAGGLLLPLVSSLLIGALRSEKTVSLGEFAGLFLHGNPFMAVESLLRYHFARDESDAVSVTARLGRTGSPLTVEELLDALKDPRFYVRFEAIVSIARRSPDERLLEGLVKILEGRDPALGVIAAWALGRIGDPSAIQPLRASLDSPYRSIRAHAARSLGSLGDSEAVPLLLEHLEQESNHGLQVAYASALGKLGAEEVTGWLLSLLEQEDDLDARQEIALSLARIVGDEKQFIQLLRTEQQEFGTALSRSLSAFRRKVSPMPPEADAALPLIEATAEILARQDLERGLPLLAEIIRALPRGHFDPACQRILDECGSQLQQAGSGRMEYPALALHVLNSGWRAVRYDPAP